MIVATPGLSALICPLESTYATVLSLLLHLIDLSVAFSGATVAVSVKVSPSAIVASDWLKVMAVTSIAKLVNLFHGATAWYNF